MKKVNQFFRKLVSFLLSSLVYSGVHIRSLHTEKDVQKANAFKGCNFSK